MSPKSKKPAGGRPARNFDPRYAAKTKRRPGDSSAGKPGSRSPHHRGYRPDETEAPARKSRWSAQERAGRDEARAIRSSDRRPGAARPAGRDGEDRGRRRFDERPVREDHGHRTDQRRPRDERAPRTDRPARLDRAPRTDRAARPDRPARPAQRSSFRDDARSERSFRHDRRDERRPYRDERHDRRDVRHSSEPHQRAHDAAHAEHVDVVHERLQAQAVQADAGATASFEDLGIGQNIVRVLAELGAEHPFPIQAATIAPILAGRDVLARGRTGSGKTIAFGAPLVESVLRAQAGRKREFGRAPKALILAPTRELALQIDRTVQPIARSVGLFTTQIYGGVPQARQVGALKKGVDIIIGTPGRIEDLVEQRKLDLSEVAIAVLDEADHMSELGFLEPIQRILRLVAAGAQKLMFSATLDREVAALVDEFLVEPEVYEVAGEDQDSGTIAHRVLVIDHRDKAEILTSLVDRAGKTLVFSRTRAYAEMLAEQFDEAGIRAVALHGDLNQAKRQRNLQRLTDGKADVLVATDVAARGIHIDDIGLVIQADAPSEYKTYLHRAGRTGRAGREGTVVTLIPRARRRRMVELLERAEIDAPFDEVRPGDDLIEELAGRQVDPTA
ncbi:DEAD/DEAH box helicase [Microbacterium sp. SYP-A9085]|uniref:DEAD/DEAH box helicase n=1 Tax=Microbacterium sp. SYP-A9085 TaxID=2664454 RepID=UPI003463C2B8